LKYFLMATLNVSFSLKDCHTRWQTDENLDASIKCTFLEKKVSLALGH